MSEATFQLAYDGEAVRNGSMDVTDLAPALLAVGDLVQNANRILNEDRASVSVRVESDFKRSSFDISLIIDQGLIDHARAFLTGYGITDAEALVKVLFGGTSAVAVIGGLVKLYRLLKGEKPKEMTVVNNHTTIIQTGSGQILNNVDSASAELYNNEGVRDAIERVVRPLRRPGIDRLDIRHGKEIIEQVSKEESEYFSSGPSEPKEEDKLVDDLNLRVLEIVRLAFREGIKSRFSDGTVEFEANVTDSVFIRNIEKGEAFAKGDSLRVYLRHRTWRDKAGTLRSEYEVTEVVEHIRRPQQLPLQ
jgi:hypothetical protein